MLDLNLFLFLFFLLVSLLTISWFVFGGKNWYYGLRMTIFELDKTFMSVEGSFIAHMKMIVKFELYLELEWLTENLKEIYRDSLISIAISLCLA